MFFFIVYIILNFHRSFHDNCIGVLWLQFLQIYWSLSFCDLILSVVNLLFLFYLFVFLSCFPHIFKVVFGFWIQRYKILSYTFAFYLLLWRRAKLCVLTILSWSFKRLLCLLLCNRICELSIFIKISSNRHIELNDTDFILATFKFHLQSKLLCCFFFGILSDVEFHISQILYFFHNFVVYFALNNHFFFVEFVRVLIEVKS